MEDEPDPATASLELALFWRGIYTEILAMEEAVLERIRQLMATQSRQARREVELTNVPVVVAQADRFRVRLGFSASVRAGTPAASPEIAHPRCCGCCDPVRRLRVTRGLRFRGS